MSYKAELGDLERDGERSLTEQIVSSFEGAIESGELTPGEKLPPTRELAETAGINHLTAVRAYRRLRELGLVSSQVGRGTFVREAAPAVLPGSSRTPDGTEWQRYVLPAMSESHGDRVMAEMYRHSQARGLIPLSVGYPSSELFPFEAMRKALDESLERHDSRALQYTDIAGLPDLVEQLAALSAERGAPEEPDDIIVTSGARQGLTLAARAVLRPGDAVACEAPTFMGVLESVKSIGTRVLPGPDGRRGPGPRRPRGAARPRGDSLPRDPAALPQPDRPRPLGGAPRPPAGAGAAPRLLHRRGRDLRRPALRGRGPGLAAHARIHGHVIYVDSISKTVGGGLRVGWIAASGPVRERILREKRADDMHSATLTQLAVAGFLEAGEYPGHIERARAFYRERRDVLIEATQKHLRGIATIATERPRAATCG